MADVLGIETDMAVKAMADNVVPDLGVLKVYPECLLQRRSFTFINGFSANERLAALNNWHRLALDKITPQSQPKTWLTTVVNNRADRVARSQVFAKMLVNDLSADRHFLIGSNINGLLKYIEVQWQLRMETIVVNHSSDSEQKQLQHQFISTCQYLRIPSSPKDVQLRIEAMLSGLSVDKAFETSLLWESKEALIEALIELQCI